MDCMEHSFRATKERSEAGTSLLSVSGQVEYKRKYFNTWVGMMVEERYVEIEVDVFKSLS